MGAAFSARSDSSEGVPVVLNVYDLTPINNYLIWFGLGIFHSGIEVHGMEYGFGAHDFPSSGVFEVEPKKCPGFIYRCSIQLGRINMDPEQFREYIEKLARDYYGDTYHLISKNCNHFTDDVSSGLVGRHIPGWVNRLARIGALCNCLLPEAMRVPVAVKQISDYPGFSSEDGSESFSMMTTTTTTHEHLQFENDDTDPEKYLLSQSSSSEVTLVKESQR
ncbi:PPPDE putative thiol peptidase family protein [Rhynchospora pubera]|uniref:PPPDE putative thiol peptidase family protein n=1 Tax=Rhynchospora pubera TaxID=906938 RepID=A0AAV8EUD6_9POAL|nr:PPPDE putative thiol peptidase family protein [Rhynchospora pubera]